MVRMLTGRMVTRNARLLQTRRCCNHQIMRPFPALPEWVTLEHDVAQILTKQEDHGWYFDEQICLGT